MCKLKGSTCVAEDKFPQCQCSLNNKISKERPSNDHNRSINLYEGQETFLDKNATTRL